MANSSFLDPILQYLRGLKSFREKSTLCEGAHFDPQAGLEMKTWCSDVVDEMSPRICEVNDEREISHLVHIRNCKTYEQDLTVKGLIVRSRARFEGGSEVVLSEAVWIKAIRVFAKYGLTDELIGEVVLRKNVKGDEIIRVEIEYLDHWNPGIKKRADSDKLLFGIDVI